MKPRIRIYFRNLVTTPKNMTCCYCVYVEFPDYVDFHLVGDYWVIGVPVPASMTLDKG